MVKKEQLEESRNNAQKWLREHHVTKLIEQKQQLTEELKRKTKVTFTSCEPKGVPIIIHKGSVSLYCLTW